MEGLRRVVNNLGGEEATGRCSGEGERWGGTARRGDEKTHGRTQGGGEGLEEGGQVRREP